MVTVDQIAKNAAKARRSQTSNKISVGGTLDQIAGHSFYGVKAQQAQMALKATNDIIKPYEQRS